MEEERRAHERYRIWAPATIVIDGGEGVPAVTYDASDSGVRLLTRSSPPAGARVEVHLDLAGDPPRKFVAKGHVVRADKNADDPDGLWPERLSIALDEPVEGLEKQLLALAAEHPLTSSELL